MERRREEVRQADGRGHRADSHLVEVDAGTGSMGRKDLPELVIHVDGEPGGLDAMRRRLGRLRRDDHG